MRAGVLYGGLMSSTIRRPWWRVQGGLTLLYASFCYLLFGHMYTPRHPLALHFHFLKLYWLFLLFFNKYSLLIITLRVELPMFMCLSQHSLKLELTHIFIYALAGARRLLPRYWIISLSSQILPVKFMGHTWQIALLLFHWICLKLLNITPHTFLSTQQHGK